MLYFEKGGLNTVLTDKDLKDGLFEVLDKFESEMDLQKTIVVTSDFTRFNSRA